MRPLAPSTPPPDFKSSYGTNDEIFLSLDQINRGSPIPDDVIVHNPYQYDPSNFPDPELELNDDPELLGLLSMFGSVNPDTSCNDGQCSIGEPQVNSLTERAGSSLVDKSRDQAVDDKEAEMNCILQEDYLEMDDLADADQAVEDKGAEMDCISRGDYLELDDLADAASHSSSSDNSSCQSFKADEIFDYLGKGSTSNHAPLGFLVKGSDNAAAKETQQAPDNNKSKSPSEPSPEQAAKKLKAKRMDEGPSHARRATTSSSSSSSDEPGRATRREEKRSKKLMKFHCFMPF